MSKPIDPGHEDRRRPLRVIGPAVAGIGLVFTIIGIGSFFASFGTGEMPRYFWCAFVDLPLLALGLGICKFAFLGTMTRYVANEVAPVGKDVVNYMAAGTKDAVRDMASAVGEGFRAGSAVGAGGETKTTLHCPKCRAPNDSEARFCKACGAALGARPCENCGHVNAMDARFCESCGKAMV